SFDKLLAVTLSAALTGGSFFVSAFGDLPVPVLVTGRFCHLIPLGLPALVAGRAHDAVGFLAVLNVRLVLFAPVATLETDLRVRLPPTAAGVSVTEVVSL